MNYVASMRRRHSIVGITFMAILTTAACTTESDVGDGASSTVRSDVSVAATSTPAGIERLDLPTMYGEIWIETLPELVPTEENEVDLHVVSGSVVQIFANDCRTPHVNLDSWVSSDEPYLGGVTRFFEAFPTDDDLATRDLSLYVDPALDAGLFRLWVTCSLIEDGTDDFREIDVEVIERPDLVTVLDGTGFPVFVCPAGVVMKDDCETVEF